MEEEGEIVEESHGKEKDNGEKIKREGNRDLRRCD
jgi:hypothetical protein